MAQIPTQRPRQRVALESAVLKEATQVIVERHYLHRGRTMAQLAYWVTVDRQRAGVMLFALPRMSVKFWGYHPMQLIELARLWIYPEVQGLDVVDRMGRSHCFPVASCAVGAALRRIRSDWARKYPQLPAIKACVSWADVTLHEGTIYRAANFTEAGTSGGKQPGAWTRPNGGVHKRHADYNRKKQAFLYAWEPA